MAQESVQVANVVVQRWIWAFDNDSDAFRETLHPEIEWFPLEENHTPYYGVAAAMRYAHVKVRDGEVVHIYDHPDKTTALEAAGLSE